MPAQTRVLTPRPEQALVPFVHARDLVVYHDEALPIANNERETP